MTNMTLAELAEGSMSPPSPYDHPLFDAQIALEEEMLTDSRDNYWKAIEAAKGDHTESELRHGIQVIKTQVDAVAAHISSKIAAAETRTKARGGNQFGVVRYLKATDPHVMAFIAMKRVVDGISSQDQYAAVAMAIADAVEDEVRMQEFREQAKDKYDFTQERLKNSPHRDRRKSILRMMSGRAGVHHKLWPRSERAKLGQHLIHSIIEATGMFEIVNVKARTTKTDRLLVAKPEALELLGRMHKNLECMFPRYQAMIVPPKRWTTPRNGGYWSGLARRIALVKTRNPNLLEELKGLDLRDVYAAINAVQETPWRINARVQAIFGEAIDRRIAIGGMPALEDEALPPKPGDIETNEEAKRGWKKLAANVHAGNRRALSKRMQVVRINQLAERYGRYEAIYFPHQFDFRGRMYAVPMFLNPQGPDYAKALLEFSNGKPIADATAAGWLAIHGANLYGNDKVGLDERIGWVEQEEARIVHAAHDPWAAVDFWGEADNPWQFLAFCFEWASLKEEGYGFVSHLPIALDGSCNGLQHYSAALRDPIGGAAVNLLPCEKPNDIYAEVAKVAAAKLVRHLSAAGSDPGTPAWLAAKWAELGISRKVTKRPVMTLPYGSTIYSCREFIEEALRDQLKGKPSPFAHRKQVQYGGKDGWVDSDGIFEASLFLQPLVWEAIGEVVKAARTAMDWLKACSKLAAEENLPINWRTPDGFMVYQAYYDMNKFRIATCLDGEIMRMVVQEEDRTKIDRKRMQNGIAPNFVHSLDGCALRMFVVLAKENGLDSFSMIHDSYGTHAADVEMMGACLRSAFVDLYRHHDVLEEFREEIAKMLPPEKAYLLPPVPPKSDLDIQAVLGSDFFFA